VRKENCGIEIPSRVFLGCDGEGGMTTLREIELSCPVCGNSGGKHTDFHECATGTQPLAYLVHMCGECGYSGGERDFGRENEVGPRLREQVLNVLALRVPLGITGSGKYEAVAMVAEWQRLEERHVADLLLSGLVRQSTG